MKNSEIFDTIVRIENSVDINLLRWRELKTWPILRKIIWTLLLSDKFENQKIEKRHNYNLLLYIQKLYSILSKLLNKKNTDIDTEIIFFSRPEYLQQINNKFIDRIMDPIIELLHKDNSIVKYYTKKIPKEKKLLYDYYYAREDICLDVISISNKQRDILDKVSDMLNINSSDLHNSYQKDLFKFVSWFYSFDKLISKYSKLKEIYIACWYFPETMAICAAASKNGIKTIDVQHGKQGRYQAMYSGWTKIPDDGYDLMPHHFWCWGQPSCNHILSSSPKRKKHIPFVGGYPWVDFYKTNVITEPFQIPDTKIKVLLTLQPPSGVHKERIPKFIIDFLMLCKSEDTHFIIRIHPNDSAGYDYCQKRLKEVDSRLYSIDCGKKNLYDVFKIATHHITAFSSCCYEANLFNIPTLLFGEESKEIYQEEISNNLFSWTNNDKDDIFDWLASDVYSQSKSPYKYIDNSYDNND